MRRLAAPGALFCALTLLVARSARADEAQYQLGEKPYQFRHLECELKVPDGWIVDRDEVTVVARAPTIDATGFQLTREPFLWDEDTYAETWRRQLGDGGLDATIGKERAGRNTAWRASWENESAGGRRITVWRIHVEDNEMLYNLAFSAPRNVGVEELAKEVLKSFKCTADKPELSLRETVDRIGTATDIRFPKGWDALERQELGGLVQRFGYTVDIEKAYVKRLPGYATPHEAVAAFVLVFNPYTVYGDEEVSGTDTEGLTMFAWQKLAADTAREVLDEPRARGARHGRLRGDAAQGRYVDEQGKRRVFYAFGTRIASQLGKQTGYVIGFIADERELRLNKDLFKDVLGTLREN
jgi:hypothetical protein